MMCACSFCLLHEESLLQDIVEEVTVRYIREKMWSASEDLLLRFQATSSGPMLKAEFEARKSFLSDQEENVVKIQVRESPQTRSNCHYPLKICF